MIHKVHIKVVTPRFGLQPEPNQNIKSCTAALAHLKYKANPQERPNYSKWQKTEDSRESNIRPKHTSSYKKYAQTPKARLV